MGQQVVLYVQHLGTYRFHTSSCLFCCDAEMSINCFISCHHWKFLMLLGRQIFKLGNVSRGNCKVQLNIFYFSPNIVSIEGNLMIIRPLEYFKHKKHKMVKRPIEWSNDQGLVKRPRE